MGKPRIYREFVIDTVIGFFSGWSWMCNGQSGITPQEAYWKWKRYGNTTRFNLDNHLPEYFRGL